MPKFSTRQALWHFLRYSPGGCTRGVRSDVLACTIITPLAIVITYICLFSSEYYSQKKFVNVPAARWTSLSLLIMIVIMLTGYYLWTYSVIRMHARFWYNWWQRTCTVRYIPPSNTNIPPNIAIEQNHCRPSTVGFSRNSRTEQNRIEIDATVPHGVDKSQNKSQIEVRNVSVQKDESGCSGITQAAYSMNDASEYTIVAQDFDTDENIL